MKNRNKLLLVLVSLLSFVVSMEAQISTYPPTGGVGGGGGTVASIGSGCGATATPDPITATGTITGNGVCITIPNESSDGTQVNHLAGFSSGTAVRTNVSTDTAIGIVDSGAGTTGSAVIQVQGQHACVFDSDTIAGDYVVVGDGGTCRDSFVTVSSGSTAISSQIIGVALSSGTNGGPILGFSIDDPGTDHPLGETGYLAQNDNNATYMVTDIDPAGPGGCGTFTIDAAGAGYVTGDVLKWGTFGSGVSSCYVQVTADGMGGIASLTTVYPGIGHHPTDTFNLNIASFGPITSATVNVSNPGTSCNNGDTGLLESFSFFNGHGAASYIVTGSSAGAVTTFDITDPGSLFLPVSNIATTPLTGTCDFRVDVGSIQHSSGSGGQATAVDLSSGPVINLTITYPGTGYVTANSVSAVPVSPVSIGGTNFVLGINVEPTLLVDVDMSLRRAASSTRPGAEGTANFGNVPDGNSETYTLTGVRLSGYTAVFEIQNVPPGCSVAWAGAGDDLVLTFVNLSGSPVDASNIPFVYSYLKQ